MKNVLVTGGAGFIGSHVVATLHKDGKSIIVIDNRRTGGIYVDDEASPTRVDYMNEPLHLWLWRWSTSRGEPFHPSSLLRERNIDTIIHLASWSNVRESMTAPYKLYCDNVLSTANLINMILTNSRAKKNEVKSVVFASSSAAVNPTSHYGVSKHASEEMLKVFADQTGITVSILRFGNVYGEGQSALNGTLIANHVDCAVNEEEAQIYGDGEVLRDYIYVSDVVNAITVAVSVPGIQDVCRGELHSVNQVAEIIQKVVLNDPSGQPGVYLPFHQPARSGDKLRVDMTPGHWLIEAGWKPEVELEDGISRQYEWRKQMQGTWHDNHTPDGKLWDYRPKN